MLDTNVLLDWLLDRHPERSRQIDTLFSTSRELYVPDAIVVEVAFALEKHYGLSRATVANNISQLLSEPVINCNRTLFNPVIADYLAHPAWSFLDCCLLQYAELQQVSPVWTYDKKLINQSSNRAKAPRG